MGAPNEGQRGAKLIDDEKKRYREASRKGGRRGLSRALYAASGYNQHFDADGNEAGPLMPYDEWVAADRPDLLTYSPLEQELVAYLNEKEAKREWAQERPPR